MHIKIHYSTFESHGIKKFIILFKKMSKCGREMIFSLENEVPFSISQNIMQYIKL